MSNIIIVYDDLDARIGKNLTLCYSHLMSEINPENYNFITINGEKCCTQEIESTITSLNQNSFIFIAYTHGNEDSLISFTSPDGYVTIKNAYFFGKSLIYTNSCSTAIRLKDALINEGCLGYVGYDGEVLLPYDQDDDLVFINCENKAIIHFLNSDDTLSESVAIMKNFYETQYDKLAPIDFVKASRLLINKRQIVYFDNFNITRNSFVSD